MGLCTHTGRPSLLDTNSLPFPIESFCRKQRAAGRPLRRLGFFSLFFFFLFFSSLRKTVGCHSCWGRIWNLSLMRKIRDQSNSTGSSGQCHIFLIKKWGVAEINQPGCRARDFLSDACSAVSRVWSDQRRAIGNPSDDNKQHHRAACPPGGNDSLRLQFLAFGGLLSRSTLMA